MKDPDTGRRRSREQASDRHVVTDVPALQIVPQELWDAIKARQATLDAMQAASAADGDEAPFWSMQRPRYPFSGLMRCGVCGGGFSQMSANHFGCSTARNKARPPARTG